MFDKYAPYIFWAYGIAAAVLIGLTIWSIWRVGHARRKLDAVEPRSAETEKQS